MCQRNFVEFSLIIDRRDGEFAKKKKKEKKDVEALCWSEVSEANKSSFSSRVSDLEGRPETTSGKLTDSRPSSTAGSDSPLESQNMGRGLGGEGRVWGGKRLW